MSKLGKILGVTCVVLALAFTYVGYELHKCRSTPVEPIDTTEIDSLKVQVDSLYTFYTDTLVSLSVKSDSIFNELMIWQTRWQNRARNIDIPKDPDELTKRMNELSE